MGDHSSREASACRHIQDSMVVVTSTQTHVAMDNFLLDSAEMPSVMWGIGVEAILPHLHTLVEDRNCGSNDSLLGSLRAALTVDDLDVTDAHGLVRLQAEIASGGELCVANGVGIAINALVSTGFVSHKCRRQERLVPMVVIASIDNHLSQVDEGISSAT